MLVYQIGLSDNEVPQKETEKLFKPSMTWV